MNNVVEYNEIRAFHPGYYIADIIEDMGITQAEFAERMGTTPKTLSKLVNGEANISNDLAKKLSTMLGMSVDVWLNLQKEYDKKLIEIELARDFDEQKELLKEIDYGFFVTNAGLPYVRNSRDKLTTLCKYFAVSDLRTLNNPMYLVNFRKSISSESDTNIVNSMAWIQTAINISKSITTADYDPSKLRAVLPELRKLTLLAPEEFVPRIRETLAGCGVAFVILPHLKNSGVNGAVKWVSGERAVLAMNNRGLNADIFWFSFFHEIRHVLQHKVTMTLVNSSIEELSSTNRDLEDDADCFAREFLIPSSAMREFAPDRFTSDEEIIGFANRIGIHPGIVAGRLQHDGIIPYSRCSKLKEKYDWSKLMPNDSI